ncbi:hypothetical protein [Accumulibacter sp.]|uniref:hypothetical protein n=1 Tax=Accumulibacter sp. TaxID=2053492 RepID=UPI0028C42FBB|nr:hypothetical protein [Accumulibacter sp.]
MEKAIDFLVFPKVVNRLMRFGRVDATLVALQGGEHHRVERPRRPSSRRAFSDEGRSTDEALCADWRLRVAIKRLFGAPHQLLLY